MRKIKIWAAFLSVLLFPVNLCAQQHTLTCRQLPEYTYRQVSTNDYTGCTLQLFFKINDVTKTIDKQTSSVSTSVNAGQTVTMFSGRYTSSGATYSFYRWLKGDSVVSYSDTLTFVMPDEDVTYTAEYQFDPAYPIEPSQSETDDILAKYVLTAFSPGNVALAFKRDYPDASEESIYSVLLAGKMDDSDAKFLSQSLVYYFPHVSELDLSRTSGWTEMFSSCGVEYLTIPENVRTFSGNIGEQLKSLTCYAATPPSVGRYTFHYTSDDLIVYVPKNSVSLYAAASGWQNYTILPIQEEKVANVTVEIPSGVSMDDFKGMWIELVNTVTGHSKHYVITDRTAYTFPEIIRQTEWNVTIRNERGDVFAKQEAVSVEDEDVTVTLTPFSTPKQVALSVVTPDGEDVTGQVQALWTDEEGEYVSARQTLEGLPAGKVIDCQLTLSDTLARKYVAPETLRYVVADQNNSLRVVLSPVPLLTLTGKVVDNANGIPLAGAQVVVSQLFGGRYSHSVMTRTDTRGAYTLQVAAAPSGLTFSASGYMTETVNIDETTLAGLDAAVPLVRLAEITGPVVNLSTSFSGSVAEGESPDNFFSGYSDIAFELYNVTQDKSIDRVVVQYPQLVVLDEVAEGDVVRIYATSKSGMFSAATATATFTGNVANASLQLIELGGVRASFVKNDNAEVMGSLYNAAGERVGGGLFAQGVLSFEHLPDGRYTLISMGHSPLYEGIATLASLLSTPLRESADYVKYEVDVREGTVSGVTIGEIPTLREDLQRYTGDRTSFSSSSVSVLMGNYTTLSAYIDFKPEFVDKVSDVQLLVDLPSNCLFVENSVVVGTHTGGYTTDGQQVIVPMENVSDRIRFCFVPREGGVCKPSGYVRFTYQGETMVQPIGHASVYVDDQLTISVPSRIAGEKISIKGTAIPMSTIEVYDTDVLVGTTTTRANGAWELTCNLPNAYKMTRHAIQAKETLNGSESMTPTNHVIVDNVQCAKNVMMTYYNGFFKQNIVVCFDLMAQEAYLSESLRGGDGGRTFSAGGRSYPFYQSGDFTFIIDFTDNTPSLYSDVWVDVYTTSGECRRLTAKFDEKMGKFVAVDQFVSSSVPISVEVDYVSGIQPELSSLQFDDLMAEGQTLQDEYKADLNSLKTFASSTQNPVSIEVIDDAYSLLMDRLGVEEITSSVASAETDVPDFSTMTDAEVDAYINQVLEETSIELDETDWSTPLNFITESGYGLHVSYNLPDETTLEPLGYERVPLDNGKAIYFLVNENEIVVVNYQTGAMIRQTNPTDLAAKMRIGYRSLFDGEGLTDVLHQFEVAKETVEQLFGDLEKKVDKVLSNMQEVIDRLDQTIAEYDRQISNVKQHKTDAEIKDMYRRRALLEQQKAQWVTRLKWTSRLLKGVLKLVPVADVIANIADLYGQAKDVFGIISSIPDPCPDDEEKAENLKTLGAGIITALAAVATVDCVVEILGDTEIVGGVVGAAETGGISIGATVMGVIQKVAAQIGKYVAKTAAQEFAIKMLRKGVQELKCNKNEQSSTPSSDSGNSGGGSGSSDKPKEPHITPVHDPSGYVYEGVFSNRLEGVMTTLFYKEQTQDHWGDWHEEIVKWDAEEYAQKNPLFTDANGYYNWDVPQGMWQVRYEMEGYETGHSEWLPVPPPQLDVNYGMRQKRQPEVKTVRAFEDAVEVTFDKYMMPEYLTADNIRVLIGDTDVEGSVRLLDEEESYEGSGDFYASRVRFEAARPFTSDVVTLMVTNKVRSYADVPMQETFTQTFTVEQEVRSIEVSDMSGLPYGSEVEIDVKVLPAQASAGKKLRVTSGSPLMVGVSQEEVEISNDGKATVVVQASLPGMTSLNFAVEGTDLSLDALARVTGFGYSTVATPAPSIASGSTVEPGTALTLSCATDGAVIYYTLDGSCPCEDSPSRHVYDGTPIVINSNLVLNVMAAAEGMYESEVAEYVYTVADANGLADVSGSPSVIVTPVPVRDKMTVSAGGRELRGIELTAVNGGQAVAYRVMGQQATVDVSVLPAGVYILRLKTDTGDISRKIIKVN